MASFRYKAITGQGQLLTGTIDAMSQEAALENLHALRLNNISFDALDAKEPASRGRVSETGLHDFESFNQQLGQLAKAGLPIEQGIRLIAQDSTRGVMKHLMNQVADALERGASLPEAIQAREDAFPPLYAELIEAGIASGNLPGVLLGFGRQLRIQNQIKTALWQALTYPAFCLLMFMLIFFYFVMSILPRFEGFSLGYSVATPSITRMGMALGRMLQDGGAIFVWGVIIALGIALITLWFSRRVRAKLARLLIRLPFIGAAFRNILISRWCQGVSLGVTSGLELSRAIQLTGNAIHERRLTADGDEIVNVLSAGRAAATVHARVLPPVLLTAIDQASWQGNLAEAMRQHAELYHEQAQRAVVALNAVLTPVLLLFIGVAIFLLIMVFIAPIVSLYSYLV